MNGNEVIVPPDGEDVQLLNARFLWYKVHTQPSDVERCEATFNAGRLVHYEVDGVPFPVELLPEVQGAVLEAMDFWDAQRLQEVGA